MKTWKNLLFFDNCAPESETLKAIGRVRTSGFFSETIAVFEVQFGRDGSVNNLTVLRHLCTVYGQVLWTWC